MWRGFGKTQIQKLKREKVETDKRKRRRKRRKKKKKKEEKQPQRMKRSPALPHQPPHCHSSSFPPPDWVRSACSFFFFFYIFNFIVRIRFCFLFCFWIIWDVFWEWSKVRSACSSQQLCFFFFCFSVFLFFLRSDSKGTVRSGLITVLRTVWLNRGSNGFLFFWHRPVLKLKEPWWWEVYGFSGRTVRSGPGFKTLSNTSSNVIG